MKTRYADIPAYVTKDGSDFANCSIPITMATTTRVWRRRSCRPGAVLSFIGIG